MGNLKDYETDRLQFLLDVRDRFGPLASFDRSTVIVNDPVLAVEVLRDRTQAFQVRVDFLQRRLTHAQSEETAGLGAVLRPGLRRSVVTSIDDIVRCQSQDALRLASGAPFDPMPVLEALIARSVATYYFGGQGPALVESSTALLAELSRVIGNPLALPAHLGSPRRRRIEKRHLRLRGDVTALLRQRVDEPQRPDFATDVVRRTRAGAQPLTRVADLVIGSLLAAHRVPAAAASWILMLLAEHPLVQESLAHEALAFGSSPDGPDGQSGAPQYPATLAVVLEGLRLYPPTWLVTRESTRAVELGGYRFPRGHHVMVSPYVLHRDETLHHEASEFRPSRWAGLERRSTCFLPFGTGLHACPGEHLATRALVAVTLSVLQGWRVGRVPGRVIADPRNTLVPRHLELHLTARA